MVSTPRMPTESHDVHTERLMRHAWEQLERGDRLRASEKCWAAVVHALKAVSRRHGWRHRTHVHNNVVATHLSELTGDKQVYIVYKAVEAVHRNYYEDELRESEIRPILEAATDFLQRLAAAERQLGPNPPAPDYDRKPRPEAGQPTA